MESLLLTYAGKSRCVGPSPSLTPPASLIHELQLNILMLADTVTNGNCGVHAFAIGLQNLADRGCKRLQNSNAFKKFRVHVQLGIDALLLHLRAIAGAWMLRNADQVMWGDMVFSTIALLMSPDPSQSFRVHLERVKQDGEWIDASVLHALGCIFNVDVGVWHMFFFDSSMHRLTVLFDSDWRSCCHNFKKFNPIICL